VNRQKVDDMTDTPNSPPDDTTAVVVQKAPFPVDVEGGKSYWWCVCGRSARQPFCDGAHKGTGFAPQEFKADKDGTIYFCGCKATSRAPMCDGSHAKL
jgi:CDGSH-type Zn-finger protein